MKSIQLSDENGMLLPDAYYRVIVTCMYPDSETDRELALKIISHEESQISKLGRDCYTPSSITANVLKKYNRIRGQQTVCGLVALIMTLKDGANEFGGEESLALYSSALMAEHFLECNPVYFEKQNSTGADVSELSFPKHFDRIKDAFKKNKPIAHILAASITCSEYIETLPLFDRAPEAELAFMRTAIYYQEKLSEIDYFQSEGWEVWDMIESAPNELYESLPLLPSIDMIEAIVSPSLQKRAAGK